MSTVLIAGGSGLIGSRLSQILIEQGHQVKHLSRRVRPQAPIPTFAWDLQTGSYDKKAFEGVDYIINMAGAGIADKRWTESRKKVVIESRVKSNELLLNAINQLGQKPGAYISASAVGFYGDTGDQLVDEEANPGVGFLSDSVVAWEKSIEPIIETGIRTVVLRVGIVLSTLGGALEKMLPSYRLRTGAYFGDGQQYYSWIHIDDVCRMFILAMEKQSMAGIYNAVGPGPASIKKIAKSIADAKSSAALIVPVPAFALRLAMGEMADMLLFSTRVSSGKIEKEGFQFQYSELVPAIKDLLVREI